MTQISKPGKNLGCLNVVLPVAREIPLPWVDACCKRNKNKIQSHSECEMIHAHLLKPKL